MCGRGEEEDGEGKQQGRREMKWGDWQTETGRDEATAGDYGIHEPVKPLHANSAQKSRLCEILEEDL